MFRIKIRRIRIKNLGRIRIRIQNDTLQDCKGEDDTDLDDVEYGDVAVLVHPVPVPTRAHLHKQWQVNDNNDNKMGNDEMIDEHLNSVRIR